MRVFNQAFPNRLKSGITAIFLALALSACAANGVITESTWPGSSSVIDGYDLTSATRVFGYGFSQIEARALDKPSIEDFTISGLGGIAVIDPMFSVTVTGQRVHAYYNGELIADLPRPAEADVSGWVNILNASIVAVRRHSEFLKYAEMEGLYETVYDAALVGLDSYSRYAGRSQARSNRETRNGFGGIGIRYRLTPEGLIVRSVLPESPAGQGGVTTDDIIVAVDGRSVLNRHDWSVRRLLRGPVDSTATLDVLRGEAKEPLALTVRRGLIVPQTVDVQTDGNIIIAAIKSFNQRTADTLAEAIQTKLSANSDIAGLVLDLRGDPGGLLDQAVAVSDLFMTQGRIVSTRGRHPESMQRYRAFEGDVSGGLPVVIMVDSRSASAAEIVAAALQDSGRGIIVGTSSFGKGTVQTVIRLPNDGEITLTWSRFHTPDGYAIQDLGVLPFVCTSGLEDTAETALSHWEESASRLAARKAQWRTVALNDRPARTALRSSCPAEVRLASSVDLEVAKRLILNESLYAQAVGLTATTAAHN